jgi:hypothetical protein
VVDQPILDDLVLPRVPETQQTPASQQTVQTRSATAPAATAGGSGGDAGAAMTRASQVVMKEALWKVSSNVQTSRARSDV